MHTPVSRCLPPRWGRSIGARPGSFGGEATGRTSIPDARAIKWAPRRAVARRAATQMTSGASRRAPFWHGRVAKREAWAPQVERDGEALSPRGDEFPATANGMGARKRRRPHDAGSARRARPRRAAGVPMKTTRMLAHLYRRVAGRAPPREPPQARSASMRVIGSQLSNSVLPSR